MSLSDFGHLIGSALKPSSRRTRERLLKLFRERPGREFTVQQLFLLVRPPSRELLAEVLDELTRDGLVQRVYRVESPRSHAGIKDYRSVTEIPEVLHDWTVDEEIEVDPSLIRPIFQTRSV